MLTGRCRGRWTTTRAPPATCGTSTCRAPTARSRRSFCRRTPASRRCSRRSRAKRASSQPPRPRRPPAARRCSRRDREGCRRGAGRESHRQCPSPVGGAAADERDADAGEVCLATAGRSCRSSAACGGVRRVRFCGSGVGGGWRYAAREAICVLRRTRSCFVMCGEGCHPRSGAPILAPRPRGSLPSIRVCFLRSTEDEKMGACRMQVEAAHHKRVWLLDEREERRYRQRAGDDDRRHESANVRQRLRTSTFGTRSVCSSCWPLIGSVRLPMASHFSIAARS